MTTPDYKRSRLLMEISALRAELAALREREATLRGVIETKGIGDAYRDGFSAALKQVRSSEFHADWGPKATANDGVEISKRVILLSLEGTLAALLPAPPPAA